MRRLPAPPAPPPTAAPSRPICYAAIRDADTRAALEATLTRLGWIVVPKPTGFHLVEELAGCILGDDPARPVDLIVVEDPLPGCRGTSIARGLRELGLDIPIAVIAPASPEVARLEDGSVFVLEPPIAAIGVSAIARNKIKPAAQDAAVA